MRKMLDERRVLVFVGGVLYSLVCCLSLRGWGGCIPAEVSYCLLGI